MPKHQAPIVTIHAFNSGYLRIGFRSKEIAEAARPGQFVNILTSSSNTPFLRRPISIEDVDESESIVSLLIKVVGPGTKCLENLPVGADLDLIGPLGNGFNLDQLAPNTLLVAGGIGIATFLHLARVVTKRNLPTVLSLYGGGRTRDDLPSWPDFDTLIKQRTATTEDGSFGLKGLVTEALKKDLQKLEPKQTQILCCGPTPMMKAVSDLAKSMQIPCFVSLETVMGCGVGSCLGCVAQAKTKQDEIEHLRVCKEGPVFDASILTWKGML